MENPPEILTTISSNVVLVFSQCGNMAREGLRTLVVAKKCLSEEQYQDFEVWMNPTVHAFTSLSLNESLLFLFLN